MENLILKVREEFFKRLDEKPTWGRNQIKELFIHTLTNVLLDNLDKK